MHDKTEETVWSRSDHLGTNVNSKTLSDRLVCGSIGVGAQTMASRVSPLKRDSLLDRPARTEGIVDRLQASSFGSFNRAVDRVRPLIPEVQLSLPRLVVVGSRDAGKSSLLENITKCSIFPRDRGLCTRMPIKFCLQQVQSYEARSCTIVYRGKRTPVEYTDDILHKVTNTMKEIGTFSTEELVIEVKQVEVVSQ